MPATDYAHLRSMLVQYGFDAASLSVDIHTDNRMVIGRRNGGNVALLAETSGSRAELVLVFGYGSDSADRVAVCEVNPEVFSADLAVCAARAAAAGVQPAIDIQGDEATFDMIIGYRSTAGPVAVISATGQYAH